MVELNLGEAKEEAWRRHSAEYPEDLNANIQSGKRDFKNLLELKLIRKRPGCRSLTGYCSSRHFSEGL
jgi:hypothetical protein